MIWSLSVPCDMSDRGIETRWRRARDRGNHDKHIWTRSSEGARREREGRETSERRAEEADDRYRTDKNRPREVEGSIEDCKGLKINKNGGWESETEPN